MTLTASILRRTVTLLGALALLGSLEGSKIFQAEAALRPPPSEDFQQFLERFFSDPEFHYARIKYPLRVSRIPEMSEKKYTVTFSEAGWKAFEEERNYVTRSLERRGENAGEGTFLHSISKRGKDQHVRFAGMGWGQDYYFRSSDDKWYLVEFSEDGTDDIPLVDKAATGAKGSKETLEDNIRSLLVKTGDIEKGNALTFKYVDLNGDGTKEAIVRDEEVSGNAYGLHFVFLTNPVKQILKMDGEVGYEVLTSKSKGFRDIKGLTRGSNRIYKWNGSRYD